MRVSCNGLQVASTTCKAFSRTFYTRNAHCTPQFHRAVVSNVASRAIYSMVPKRNPDASPTPNDVLKGRSTSHPKTTKTAMDVIKSLSEGNKHFVNQIKSGKQLQSQDLQADPFARTPVDAVVISCARAVAPVVSIFDAPPGTLHSLRVCGNICLKRDEIVGSCEFALEEYSPPVILVLGCQDNDVVHTAVARTMIKAGRPDAPQLPYLAALEGNGLLDALERPSYDALAQMPLASYEELCSIATEFNVWQSIEALLTSSRVIAEQVRAGELQVHGAFFDSVSGKVRMLGEHPSVGELLAELPSPDVIRSAADPNVPAEEALAALYAGNKRYTAGRGGILQAYDGNLLKRITVSGQNPIAVILGCADSRAPAELFFDARPGDLFILRNAGNTLYNGLGSTLGSAEYAVGHLHTKVIVVTGHTKCGAVTSATNAVVAGTDVTAVEGSIGHVLSDIVEAAREAVKRLPNSLREDQVQLAIELNILNAMKKIIDNSKQIKSAVIKGEVHLLGAVYDIAEGHIHWLGHHPELEAITGTRLPVHRFKSEVYESRATSNPKLADTRGSRALATLLDGNKRFVEGKPIVGKKHSRSPFGIVLGMAEVRVPLEQIFDAHPSELVVQRVEGAIAGRPGSTLFESIEYAIRRWDPKLLVVVGDPHSVIINTAVEQVCGDFVRTAPLRGVLDRVMVSAMRAQSQIDSTTSRTTAAGRVSAIRQLTTELNAFYSIEQLLLSKVIRDAVRSGLELQACVLDQQTGVVMSLGQHPALEGLLDESRY